LQIETYPTATVAYALKSLELADTDEGRVFAIRALQQGPTAILLPPQGEDTSGFPAFSPDGAWLALGDEANARLFDREGRAPRIVESYPQTDADVHVAFGPRGDTLLADYAGDVRIWSMRQGRELRRNLFERGGNWVWTTDDGIVTFTRVGPRTVIRWWPDGDGDSRLVGSLEGEDITNFSAFHGWIAYTSGRRVYVRFVANWVSPPRLVAEAPAPIQSARLSPDGQRIAAVDETGDIRIWSVAEPSHRLLRTLHGRPGDRLRFDTAGRRLALTANENGRFVAWLWDLTGPPGAEPLKIKKGDSNLVGGQGGVAIRPFRTVARDPSPRPFGSLAPGREPSALDRPARGTRQPHRVHARPKEARRFRLVCSGLGVRSLS
jgi:WD40 repeat protein